MKLRVLSDLHFEFHRDGGRTWIAGQADLGWDVLLLAGGTRVLANPFGYARYEENSKFDERLTVEIR